MFIGLLWWMDDKLSCSQPPKLSSWDVGLSPYRLPGVARARDEPSGEESGGCDAQRGSKQGSQQCRRDKPAAARATKKRWRWVEEPVSPSCGRGVRRGEAAEALQLGEGAVVGSGG